MLLLATGNIICQRHLAWISTERFTSAMMAPYCALDKDLVSGIDSKDNTLIPASANSTQDKNAKPANVSCYYLNYASSLLLAQNQQAPLICLTRVWSESRTDRHWGILITTLHTQLVFVKEAYQTAVSCEAVLHTTQNQTPNSSPRHIWKSNLVYSWNGFHCSRQFTLQS